MLEEERAQDGRAYNQEDTRAEPACGGLRGVGVAGAEFAVHLDASDKPDDRADGVDEFRRRVKVGSLAGCVLRCFLFALAVVFCFFSCGFG